MLQPNQPNNELPNSRTTKRARFDELLGHLDSKVAKVQSTKLAEAKSKTKEPVEVATPESVSNDKLYLFQKIKDFAVNRWQAWSKLTDKLTEPWGTITKYAVPVVSATVGVIWSQAFLQLGIAATQLFGNFLQPLLGTAALIAPAFLIDPAIELAQKVFKLENLKDWQKNLISLPVKGLSFLSAGLWVNSLDLTPLTYGVFAAGAVVAGLSISKLLGKANKAVWATVAAAAILPWSHLLTIRSYDVTVKSVSPDPEVGAWNVATDLTVWNHWKKIALLKKEPPPDGGVGMVLLNKDVPLLIPSHRNANVFNSEFQGLVGKKVRVTTIGTWLKPVTDHAQPIIISYKALE